MKRNLIIVFALFSVISVALGQTPVITNISTLNLYPHGTVVITGTGFNTPDNLQVWFGHVEGKILNSTEFTIEVRVPPAARYGYIDVINKASSRVARSREKFMPSFNGNGFNVSNLAALPVIPANGELRDICSCDLNLDGWPDLAATKFSATDYLILRNTTSTATPHQITFSPDYKSLGFSSDHVTCGDVDGDGRPDLVMTRGGSSNRNTVFLLLNTTTTTTSITFAPPSAIPLDLTHVALQPAIRDLNNDGRPEIIVTNSQVTSNLVYVYPNDPAKAAGANPFDPAKAIKIPVAGATGTYGLDVADVDGDGLPDLILNAVSSPDHYILLNRSTSTTIEFAAAAKVPLSGQLRNVTTADVNKDGKPDLITTSTLTNATLILINESTAGTVKFKTTPIVLSSDIDPTVNKAPYPWGVSVGDIDGDGDPDITLSHQQANTAHIFLHDGNFGNPAFTKYILPTANFARNHVTGDLNRDGKPDMALATSAITSYGVQIFRNTICHKPQILNESPLYVCNNPIELRAIPALNTTFEWRRDNTLINPPSPDPFVSINTAGTYTVTASTISPAGECTGVVSQTFTVSGSAGSVPQDPLLTINSPVCAGGSINMSTTNVAGASYKWTGPGWTTTTTTASTTIPNVTSANAGIYMVQIITGECKSNVSAGKTVDVVSIDEIKLVSNSSTNASCEPNPVRLAATSISGFTYEWKKDGGTYSAPTLVNTFDAFADGQYTVRVSNAGLGCAPREIGPIRVAILAAPVANFNLPESRCANAPVQFFSSSQVDPDALGTDPVAPVQYAWNFGDGKNSIEENPKNTFITGGLSYNVSLTVSYRGVTGCTSTKVVAVTITNATAPILTASPASICPDETSTISVTPTFTSVVWDHGPTGATIDVTQPGTYTANARDASGCIIPKSITIASKDTPQLTVTADPPVIPSGQSSKLNAVGAHTYEWTPPETLSNPNVADPIATPTQPTTYTVTGSFIGGCSASAQVTVTIDGSLINITPPAAFSPNGDSVNDLWLIEGVESYPDCVVNIFDGRGRRIYQKKGYTNDWDGSFEGKPVPGGTYYYVFACPGSKPLTGSVLVFR